MPMTDPFVTSKMGVIELTSVINKLKYNPQLLGQLGLFDENGISTLSVAIEEKAGVLRIVPVAPRGAPGQGETDGARVLRSFTVPHLPERATVTADEVQGVRVFGSNNAMETVVARRNEKLQIIRDNLDYTMESHRVAAVKGSYIDANGDAVSLFTEFGVTQQTAAMNFSASATSAQRTVAMGILAQIESALDGMPYTGVRIFCGATFWTTLLEDYDAKVTYLNTSMASDLRQDPRMEFMWNGFLWTRYRGTSDVLIPASEAYAVPTGVNGLFITRFAPANYVETVNTIGIPYYAKSELMEFGKGWRIEGQSNPINLCTRPAAVIKLTLT